MTANEVTTTAGRLPGAARRLDTREWVMGLDTAPTDLQQACGWYEVTDTTRPADDATTTYDRSVTWDGKTVAVTWTARPKTTAEVAADTATANRTTIIANAKAALTRLRAIRDANKATFSGLTAAQRDSQLFDAITEIAGDLVGLARIVADDLTDGTT